MRYVLYINPWRPRDPARADELAYVEARNRTSGFWNQIVHVGASPDHRPTFADFFRATADQRDHTIHVIANSDIYFDRTLFLATQLFRDDSTVENTVLALSRWNMLPERVMAATPSNGADAWIFCNRLRDIPGADFPMGRPGCDARINQLLADAGYLVINPCYSIHAIHLHHAGHRTYNPADQIPGPYLWVPPTDITGKRGITPEQYQSMVAKLAQKIPK